jgi:HTH-type transcriptional regulator/antitoxin HigA
MHEWSHIANHDALSVDTDVLEPSRAPAATDETEARANREAATTLIAENDLVSFIRRVGPYYARERVVQFAHLVQIHPGIIVGQLQHRGEIGYAALRDLLPKIRDVVTETAITDGWGKSISPSIL